MSRAPILDAYRVETTQCDLLKVWCRHCNKWHVHGVGDQPAIPSHRVAHCARDDSPYKQGGYYLREVGKLTERVKREARRNGNGW